MGSLYICEDYHKAKQSYELLIGIVSNGFVRSRTRVDVHLPSMLNKIPQVSLGNQVAWVRENVQPGIRILRIRPITKLHETHMFKIEDPDLKQVIFHVYIISFSYLKLTKNPAFYQRGKSSTEKGPMLM